MAQIHIDRSKLIKAAGQVEQVADQIEINMNNAANAADALPQGWEGKDYVVFRDRLKAIYGNDSVSKAMVRSMRAYADYLRFAEAQYKEAQIRAINKADGLKRRWF